MLANDSGVYKTYGQTIDVIVVDDVIVGTSMPSLPVFAQTVRVARLANGLNNYSSEKFEWVFGKNKEKSCEQQQQILEHAL